MAVAGRHSPGVPAYDTLSRHAMRAVMRRLGRLIDPEVVGLWVPWVTGFNAIVFLLDERSLRGEADTLAQEGRMGSRPWDFSQGLGSFVFAKSKH